MRDCSAERANAQPDGVWHLAHGKTVRVFPHDLNHPAAAAPFALAKGEGTKRGRQAMPVSLFVRWLRSGYFVSYPKSQPSKADFAPTWLEWNYRA